MAKYGEITTQFNFTGTTTKPCSIQQHSPGWGAVEFEHTLLASVCMGKWI